MDRHLRDLERDGLTLDGRTLTELMRSGRLARVNVEWVALAGHLGATEAVGSRYARNRLHSVCRIPHPGSLLLRDRGLCAFALLYLGEATDQIDRLEAKSKDMRSARLPWPHYVLPRDSEVIHFLCALRDFIQDPLAARFLWWAPQERPALRVDLQGFLDTAESFWNLRRTRLWLRAKALTSSALSVLEASESGELSGTNAAEVILSAAPTLTLSADPEGSNSHLSVGSPGTKLLHAYVECCVREHLGAF